eukprot:6182115-Pleurochrysis_carterae.AAC.3
MSTPSYDPLGTPLRKGLSGHPGRRMLERSPARASSLPAPDDPGVAYSHYCQLANIGWERPKSPLTRPHLAAHGIAAHACTHVPPAHGVVHAFDLQMLLIVVSLGRVCLRLPAMCEP